MQLPRAFLRRLQGTSEQRDVFKIINDFPLLTLWNLVLALGGLMLLVFFASIQFLPELDITSLVAILAALALVAFYLVFMIGLSMVLPSFYLDAKQLDEKPTRLLYLLEACLGIVGCFLVVFAIFETSTGFDYWLAISPYGTSFIALLIAIGGLTQKISQLEVKGLLFQLITKTALRGFLWGAWCLFLPALFMVLLRKRDLPTWHEIWLLIAFPLTLATISLVVARHNGKRRLVATLIAAVASVLYLGFLTDKADLIPKMSVTALGLSMPNKQVSLVLTEPGCAAVNATIGKEICRKSSGQSLGTLNNVHIISRIGSQFLLHLPTESTGMANTNRDQAESTQWLRLVIRSSDVIAWSYIYSESK